MMHNQAMEIPVVHRASSIRDEDAANIEEEVDATPFGSLFVRLRHVAV